MKQKLRIHLPPKLQQRIDAFPLRLNFFLLLALFIAGYQYVSKQQLIETSSFLAVFTVLLKLVMVFAIILIICSLISTLIPFFLFSNRVRTEKDFFNVGFDAIPGDTHTQTIAKVTVERLTTPLLGCVKARFYYSNGARTKAYTFPSRGFSSLFAGKARLVCPLDLKDVRSYLADSVGVHFEDMLRLFSFSHRYPVNQQFYTFPQKIEVEQLQARPATATETNVRTDVVRRIEGELLQFKSFEPSDDIRRIIWKIYAKSKELVVRTPEMRNPYASEISFLASYSNSLLNSAVNGNELNVFLNHYKHTVWSIYSELLASKEVSVKLLSDQQLQEAATEEASQAQHTISASRWQNSSPISQVQQANNLSVVMLTSLADADDVGKMAGKLSKSANVVLCRLSKTFDSKAASDYLRMLFVKPQQGEMDKPLWMLSPIRALLAKNELKLEEALRQSDAAVFVIDI